MQYNITTFFFSRRFSNCRFLFSSSVISSFANLSRCYSNHHHRQTASLNQAPYPTNTAPPGQASPRNKTFTNCCTHRIRSLYKQSACTFGDTNCYATLCCYFWQDHQIHHHQPYPTLHRYLTDISHKHTHTPFLINCQLFQNYCSLSQSPKVGICKPIASVHWRMISIITNSTQHQGSVKCYLPLLWEAFHLQNRSHPDLHKTNHIHSNMSETIKAFLHPSIRLSQS